MRQCNAMSGDHNPAHSVALVLGGFTAIYSSRLVGMTDRQKCKGTMGTEGTEQGAEWKAKARKTARQCGPPNRLHQRAAGLKQ